MDAQRVVLNSVAFHAFLKKQEIDPLHYAVDFTSFPRYFRRNHYMKSSSTSLQDLTSHLEEVTTHAIVSINDDFIAIFPNEMKQSIQCSSIPAFIRGEYYAMECSSGFAVQVLAPEAGETIVDLCCAPGPKLAYIADLMSRKGIVYGVDVSLDRLSTCKSLLWKYGLVQHAGTVNDWTVRLVHGDGRNTTLQKCILDTSQMHGLDFQRRRNNKSTRVRWKQSNVVDNCPTIDRILVDAECTHDGSIKHLLKSAASVESFENYVHTFLNAVEVDRILLLQRDLLQYVPYFLYVFIL